MLTIKHTETVRNGRFEAWLYDVQVAETLAEILHTAIPKVGEYIETTFADRTIRFWRMPSSSRAYPLSFDKKAAAYQRMFNSLISPSICD